MTASEFTPAARAAPISVPPAAALFDDEETWRIVGVD